jgi:phage terminase large subunit-like protein
LTVTPAVATDTVSITEAVYNARKDKVDVEAVSSDNGAVTLTAKAFDSGGHEMGSTVLSYNRGKHKHSGSIDGLPSKPFRVEVVSSGGGSDSVEGAAIGGK